MKKLIITILAITLLFGFVACQNEEPVVDVASISLDKELIAINDSNSGYAVKATVYPVDASNKQLVYSSDNEAIVVKQNGAISLKDGWSEDSHYYGKIKIASKMNPSVVRYCYVTVNYDVIKKDAIAVKLPEAENAFETVDIYGGKTITPVIEISDKYDMKNLTNLDELFTITSSDPEAVSVNEKTGEITALDKAGTATITIESNVPYFDEETKTYVKAKEEYEVCVNPVRTTDQLAAFLSSTDEEGENPSGISSQKTAYIAEDISEMTPVAVKGEKTLDLKEKEIEFKKADATVNYIDVVTTSDLTIKGTGKVSASGDDGFTLINNDGALDLQGGTYETNSDKDKKSCIVTGTGDLEVKEVKLVANGKTDNPSSSSEVYAIKSSKTDGTILIGEGVSIEITGGGSAYGIKTEGNVDATKGLSITVKDAKDATGIAAGNDDKVELKNGSVKITSEKTGSTACALSGGTVEVTDGNYDISSDGNSELINSVVSAVLKRLNTNVTINITGGNVTIVNGNSGTIETEGGLYTATATGTSGVAKGFDTTGNVEIKSIDLSVTGDSAIGVKGKNLTIEKGTYDIEAKGETVSTATATGFIFEGPTCLSSPTVTIEAKGVARIADVGENAASDASLEVEKGSYTATSSESDAVAFGGSSDPNGMSVPATFSGSANVTVTADNGKAKVIESHSDLTIGKDETKGGSFEATGKDACVFDLDNPVGNTPNEVIINNVEASATSEEVSEGTGSNALVVYSNNNKTDISGGTFKAESDNQSTAFELKNCSESSVNVEKASASGDLAICLKAETSDLNTLGGEFISESEGSESKDKASGIELKNTNCTILKDTVVKVESKKEAYGICVVEDKKPIEIDIEKGLDVDVESTDDSAYGVKFDKDPDDNVSDLKVNIKDGDVTVHASGDDEVIALWNTGELNFENNTDGDVFKGTFEAETDDGVAIGLLNGDFDDTNWESARNGNKAELEEEGMINFNGETDVKFTAKASDGDSSTPTSNYAGDMTVYTNDQPVGKGEEFSDEYDTGNGAVLSFSNVSESASSYITFTVDNTVNNKNGNRKTYQVPEGTTWYQLVNNDLLGHSDMVETAEGKIVNNANLSTSDSNKYYISFEGKAVDSADDIEDGAEYYYGTPFKLGSENYYAEKDSTWSDFVKESYNDYKSDTKFQTFPTVVEGDSMGAGKYHIATYDGSSYTFVNATTDPNNIESIEYNGSYYIVLDFSFKTSGGTNKTVYIEKDITWEEYAAVNQDFKVSGTYVKYGNDYVAYKDGEDFIYVKKSAKVSDIYDYVLVVKFFLTTYNGSVDVKTEYVVKAGSTWSDFVADHSDFVLTDNDKVGVGNSDPLDYAKVCYKYHDSTTNTFASEKMGYVTVNMPIFSGNYWTAYTVKYHYYYEAPSFSKETEGIVSVNIVAGKTLPSNYLNLEYKVSPSAHFGGWFTSKTYTESSRFTLDQDKVTSSMDIYEMYYSNLTLKYVLNSEYYKDWSSVNKEYNKYYYIIDIQCVYGQDYELLEGDDELKRLAEDYENEHFGGWSTVQIKETEHHDGDCSSLEYSYLIGNNISHSCINGRDFKKDGIVILYAVWYECKDYYIRYSTELDVKDY